MDVLRKYKKELYIFLLVGFIAYLPILFNGFVWDDLDYFINNPQMQQLNFPVLLGPNIFNSGAFYRPIPAIYFATLYTLFRESAFFYHVIQLLLHMVNTTLLFVFFCLFFRRGIAFFLALVFLIHPINVESVAFIGSTTSELFLLFGLSAFFLAKEHELSRERLVLVSLLLLLSALTKETGALFLFVIIAYRFFFKMHKVKELALAGLSVAAVYLLLRILLGGVTYKAASDIVPIATLSLSERLVHIPAIIAYYLQTFVFPLKLAIWQQWVISN
jgi:hypothetical protein